MFEADVLIVSILILCVISYSYANTCNAFFKVKSICNTNYGTPLRRYTDNQSKAKCALACSQDASCFSSVFDSHTGVFQTFPEYKSLGECVTEEFYSAVFQVWWHIAYIKCVIIVWFLFSVWNLYRNLQNNNIKNIKNKNEKKKNPANLQVWSVHKKQH